MTELGRWDGASGSNDGVFIWPGIAVESRIERGLFWCESNYGSGYGDNVAIHDTRFIEGMGLSYGRTN